MMWQGRVGQFCDFAGVRIWEGDSICFDMNIADYIEAVHADYFGAAIGQIAVCEPGRVHYAARSCARRNPRIRMRKWTVLLGGLEMRIRSHGGLTYRADQVAGNAAECRADAGRKAIHRNDRTQSDQGSHKGILNQVLTRIVTKQLLQGLKMMFH